jgi:DivIVA domain-containing protein
MGTREAHMQAREIEERTFPIARRGYSRDEVTSFLTDVARHQSQLEEQLAIANARAERAREELDSYNDVLERRLAETNAAREAILEDARREAAAIVGTSGSTDPEVIAAEQTATAIRKEAEARAAVKLREAEEAVAAARQRADAIIHEAEDTAAVRLDEADRVLDEARRTARTIRLDTERDRSEIEDHLKEVRALLVAAHADGTGALEDSQVILTKGTDIIVDLRAGAHMAVPVVDESG